MSGLPKPIAHGLGTKRDRLEQNVVPGISCQFGASFVPSLATRVFKIGEVPVNIFCGVYHDPLSTRMIESGHKATLSDPIETSHSGLSMSNVVLAFAIRVHFLNDSAKAF
jgi:hypothetical protein